MSPGRGIFFATAVRIYFQERQTSENSIILPLSKSECNRALMLQAWSGGKISCARVSDAADSQLLNQLLLQKEQDVYDACDAGTTFRFLASWLALRNRQCLLTGTKRMKERPVEELVIALSELGCRISFPEKKGHPPLLFEGCEDSGKNMVKLSTRSSSQFISSLMMAAPALPRGLHIRLSDRSKSFSYIEMTAAMMKKCGLMLEMKADEIHIPAQRWPEATLVPGADWSSASYFYGILSRLPVGSSFSFPGLSLKSRQGDRIMAELAKFWHIETQELPKGVRILRTAEGFRNECFRYDFSDCPDLALTLIACCAASGTAGEFYGLSSLRLKESNRLMAMQEELQKVGLGLFISEDFASASLKGTKLNWPEMAPVFHCHHDHRIAMALSILAVGHNREVIFDDPEVVNKSFPGFWKEMEDAGIIL